MVDTLYADISEFQPIVNDAYPYRFICIRSNDGNHRDTHFAANRAWCDRSVASGKIAGYLVYYFWRPGGSGVATHRAMVGTPSPHMATMIDVEAGSGARGNQSAAINAEYTQLVAWHGGDARRVIGYGNVGDLNTLWPQRPAGIRLVIADYSANPSYPGKFAHQYTDRGACPPFGTCDMNSADGLDLGQVTGLLGLGSAPPAPSPATGDDDLTPEQDAIIKDIQHQVAGTGAVNSAFGDLLRDIQRRLATGETDLKATGFGALTTLDQGHRDLWNKLAALEAKIDALNK